jgi:PPOX class probable F420-dependent enzyme
VTPEEARRRFATAAVARLATVGASGLPHLVPLVFALAGDRVVSAVDAKPKRSMALRRLVNVSENPRVSLLVDHYEDDWSALWWARADGTARILDATSPGAEAAVDLLAARYEQYRRHRPVGPVLEVEVQRWSGWAATV